MSARLLSIPEAAARLGISRTSVYDVIAAGELDTVDIGTGRRPRTRITADSLDRYIQRRLQPGRRASRSGHTSQRAA